MIKNVQRFSVGELYTQKKTQKHAGDLKCFLLQKLYEYQLQSITEKKNRNMCHLNKDKLNIFNMIKIIEYILHTHLFSEKFSSIFWRRQIMGLRRQGQSRIISAAASQSLFIR